MKLQHLDAVAEEFVAAAVDPSRWPNAMDTAASSAGALGAALFPICGQVADLPRSTSLDVAHEFYVKDGWIDRDERRRAWPLALRKGTVTDFDIMSLDQMARHPYYQDFLVRFGFRWFAGVPLGSTDDPWCLSLQRTTTQFPFSQAEVNELAGFASRLTGTLQLARALGHARAEAALQAFDLSDTAVVLVDRHGEVCRMNRAADDLMGGEFYLSGKRFTCWHEPATKDLDRALHQLLRTLGQAASMPPVTLPRKAARPLLAYAMRAGAITADALAACQAIIVLVDLGRRKRPQEAALRAVFALTAAESRLAARLVAGADIATVADELGITYETARTQLKSVLGKTNTHRQAELVSLISSMSLLG